MRTLSSLMGVGIFYFSLSLGDFILKYPMCVLVHEDFA